MAQNISVPDIGDFKDVEVIEVLVKPGDQVNKNDPIVTIETDKSSLEIPSPSSGEINFNVKNVDESISIVKNSFEKEFDTLDGISYFEDDYWFNIRGSNTEPKLRLNAEAKNIEILNELVNKIRNIIER